MSRFDPYFRQALEKLSLSGRLRRAQPFRTGHSDSECGPYLDLRSNDYLGLSRHPVLAQRAAAWAESYGTGAGASRLVSGSLFVHERVETRLASLKNTESALLFASGWQANASVLAALLTFSQEATGGPPQVFMDRLNHASLQFACQAAGARQHRFHHNDMDHLEALLKQAETTPGLRYVVTESVFSMDGDCAPLKALRAMADRYNAFLYIDDAHATGILGEGGRGLACAVAPDLILGTCGKALGSMGAFVAGSRLLCDWIVNRCSGFIYSTAPSPPMLGAIHAALEILPSLDTERARVCRMAERFKSQLRGFGLDTGASCTHIVPVIIGDSMDTVAVADRLRQNGILTTPIRPPTVPPGAARLRIALHNGIVEEDIDRIALQLATIVHETRSVA